jgi:phage terminase Nu1 subunit (DNA packaging protein)
MSMLPGEFTLSALAVELRIGQRALARRLADLPPHRVDGRRRFWRLADVLDHLHADADPDRTRLDPQQERARLDRARRVLAELDASVRRGELIPQADMTAAWAGILGAVRQRLLELPTRAAPLVADATPAEAERVLRDLVHEVLAELRDDCLARARACADPDKDDPPRANPAGKSGDRVAGSRRPAKAAAGRSLSASPRGRSGLTTPTVPAPDGGDSAARGEHHPPGAGGGRRKRERRTTLGRVDGSPGDRTGRVDR